MIKKQVQALRLIYVTNDYPNYQMVFSMEKDNMIVIKENNITTGKDYGGSPYCGMNVRFFGEYLKLKKHL